MRPRILGLSMVKNEQDIIEPFLRHNAPLLDALVLVDNASLDDTRKIASACARELGNIVIGDSEEFGYLQAERMTRMLQYCQGAFFADYILFLDADEFISAPNRTELESVLSAIPRGGVGYIPWRTFIIAPGEEVSVAADPPRNFSRRRVTEIPQYYKIAIRLDGAFVPDLVVGQGNHDANINGRRPPSVYIDELRLFHFPIRSGQQICSKAVVGWMAYLARNPNARAGGMGLQWCHAFDRVAVGGQKALSDGIAESSINYAQARPPINWQSDAVLDSPPSGYERKYSTGVFADPLALLARTWERSLSLPTKLIELERSSNDAVSKSLSEMSFGSAWQSNNAFVDVAPFRFIAEKYQPNAVLDIGCGIGQYLALFRKFGAKDVLGTDDIPALAVQGFLEASEYLARDLTQPLDLGRRFDLVICVEVAARLAVSDCTKLLDSVERHAKDRIIFSAAEPNQPGNGLVNCKPLSHWLDEWASRGWVPDLMDSLGTRMLATMSWFRRNLIVLRRGSQAEGANAAAALIAISEKSYTWYDQIPGVREFPFQEPPPGSGKGYHD